MNDQIRTRLILVLIVDVASGEVLGWSLSERTGAGRLATRGMEREARLYQCFSKPLPPMGVGIVVIDNGAVLRNTKVIEGAAQAGIAVQVARAGRPTHKAHVERRFRTLQLE